MTNIVITIGDKTWEFTLEEAKTMKSELRAILPDPIVYRSPFLIWGDKFPTPWVPVVTCASDSNPCTAQLFKESWDQK